MASSAGAGQRGRPGPHHRRAPGGTGGTVPYGRRTLPRPRPAGWAVTLCGCRTVDGAASLGRKRRPLMLAAERGGPDDSRA
eukprot:765197-Hanusia_phi.AAC.1